MDISKVRVFEVAVRDLAAVRGDSFALFDRSVESLCHLNNDPVMREGLVYVYDHEHPGSQTTRCFWRLRPGGRGLEALWHLVYSGTVIREDYAGDLFRLDPIAGPVVALLDRFQITTTSGDVFVIDGQHICRPDELDDVRARVNAVMEGTARYASYFDGRFRDAHAV